MTPQEIDDFLSWVIDNYGLSEATQISLDALRDPDVFINHPYYQEYQATQGALPEAPFPTGIPQAGGPGVEPEHPVPDAPTIVWYVPSYEEDPRNGIGKGAILWSNGAYSDATLTLEGFFTAMSEEQALPLKEYFDNIIAIPGQPSPSMGTVEYDESGLPIFVIRDGETGDIISQSPLSPNFFPEDEPTFGEMEIISEAGHDWAIFYDENGQPMGEPQYIGRTEDRGMDEYEAALIDIQNQRLGLEERQVGVAEERLGFEQFQFENLSAWQQVQFALMMKPWEQLTAAEKAQFAFDRDVFEQQKLQWREEFEQGQFEFEAQQEFQLRQLGLQERIAQTEIQKAPMDWIARWQFSNPTWSGQPRGTPNPQAQPSIPIPQGGFPPQPQGGF